MNTCVDVVCHICHFLEARLYQSRWQNIYLFLAVKHLSIPYLYHTTYISCPRCIILYQFHNIYWSFTQLHGSTLSCALHAEKLSLHSGNCPSTVKNFSPAFFCRVRQLCCRILPRVLLVISLRKANAIPPELWPMTGFSFLAEVPD